MANSLKRTAIIIAALLPIVVLGFFLLRPSGPSPLVLDANATSDTNIFHDGTYTATAPYQSPGGSQTIGVTLTLQQNIITDVSLAEGASDPRSQQWQERFASGYKTFVVGKNLAGLQLSNVSGSSLTPRAFNDALAQIESQAVVL